MSETPDPGRRQEDPLDQDARLDVGESFGRAAHESAWATVLEHYPNAGKGHQEAARLAVTVTLNLVRRYVRDRQPDPTRASLARIAQAVERLAVVDLVQVLTEDEGSRAVAADTLRSLGYQVTDPVA